MSYTIEGASRLGAAIKGASTLLARAGYGPRQLDAGDLIGEARRRTGLSDFGPHDAFEPLDVLLHSMEREADLSEFGRFSAYQETLQLLINRLNIVEARKRHPGIAREPIDRPIFIVGLPRSGTTFLHGLLAQDPASRAPLTWETMEPPGPAEAPAGRHRLLESKAHWRIRSFHSLAPEFRRIHAVEAMLPQECIAITAHSFISARFDNTYRIPSYQAWLDTTDQAPAFVFHKTFLQHLQYGSPEKRWVLKAPAHLFTLEQIFATYPDALVVHTHRDPTAVLPSVSSLIVALRRVFCRSAEAEDVGVEMVERWGLAADRALTARRAIANGKYSDQVIDLHYSDLAHDPLSAAEDIYRRFGLDLEEPAKLAMMDYLAKNPKGKHGRHDYALADFGLDTATVNSRFQSYNQAFQVVRTA